MRRVAVLLAGVASASAFAPTTVLPRSGISSPTPVSLNARSELHILSRFSCAPSLERYADCMRESDSGEHSGRVAAATTSPSMQLFGDGKIQGKGVVAIPPLGRPETEIFDGAMRSCLVGPAASLLVAKISTWAPCALLLTLKNCGNGPDEFCL